VKSAQSFVLYRWQSNCLMEGNHGEIMLECGGSRRPPARRTSLRLKLSSSLEVCKVCSKRYDVVEK
jgi:hypothetical protein